MKRFSASTSKKLSALVIGILIANVVVILLRICSLKWFYDTEIGYYQADAPLPLLGNILLTVFVIGAALFALFGFQKNELSLPKPTKLPRMVAILPAMAALLATVGSMVSNDPSTYVSALPFKPSVLFTLCAICAFLVAIFFILLATGTLEKNKFGYLTLLIGFFALLYFVCALAIAYFDFEIQMNSPNKLIFMLANLSAVLAIFAEIRILVGEPKPRFALLAFSIATLLLGTSSIPSVFAYMSNIFPAHYRNLPADFVGMALWCYCLIRLIWIAYPTEKKAVAEAEPSQESKPTPEEEMLTDETAEAEEKAVFPEENSN